MLCQIKSHRTHDVKWQPQGAKENDTDSAMDPDGGRTNHLDVVRVAVRDVRAEPVDLILLMTIDTAQPHNGACHPDVLAPENPVHGLVLSLLGLLLQALLGALVSLQW